MDGCIEKLIKMENFQANSDLLRLVELEQENTEVREVKKKALKHAFFFPLHKLQTIEKGTGSSGRKCAHGALRKPTSVSNFNLV